MVNWDNYIQKLVFLNEKVLGSGKDILETHLTELVSDEIDRASF